MMNTTNTSNIINQCYYCGQKWTVAQPALDQSTRKDWTQIFHSLTDSLTTFFAFQDLYHLGLTNRAWSNVILINKNKSKSLFFHRQASHLAARHIRQALYNIEDWPMTGKRLIRLAKLERLFNVKINLSCINYVYTIGADCFASLALQKLIHQPHEPFNPLDLKRLGLSREELPHYMQALAALSAGCGLLQLSTFPELISLKIFSGHPLTDDQLAPIASLKQLRILDLTAFDVTDEGLKFLLELPSLKTLYLEIPNMTDAGLDNLKNLFELDFLQFRKSKITGVGLHALANLTELTFLKFEECKNILATHVTQLAHLSKLKYLIFDDCFPLNNKRAIGCFRQLEGLSFRTCGLLEGADLEQFKKMTSLQDLILAGCYFTGSDLMQLSTLTQLRLLDISNAYIYQCGSVLDHLNTCLPGLNIKKTSED